MQYAAPQQHNHQRKRHRQRQAVRSGSSSTALSTKKDISSGLQVTAMALRERVPEQLAGLLTASHPELRAAAVFTLGALVQVHSSAVKPCIAQSPANALLLFRQIFAVHTWTACFGLASKVASQDRLTGAPSSTTSCSAMLSGFSPSRTIGRQAPSN